MAKQYDLITIGSGTAGSVAASRCRAAGWRVAVIDHVPFGGTCALRGCDPKKVLVGASAAVDHVRRMHRRGVEGDPTIAWRELISFKRSFTKPVPAAKEESFAESGIDAYHGRARFRGPQSIEVDGTTLEARFILLATGAVPMRLGIAGEEHIATSTDFLELEQLPKRIVMLGGGFIAAEFAHVAARAGSEVTVLEQAERMLTPFDPDLVEWLMDRFEELGIDVRLKSQVVAVEKLDRGYHVRTASNEVFEADLVVHGAGRVPDLAALDLPTANVATDKGRLQLNEFLQSETNPAVYAAGDVASNGPPLTPVASRDARAVAANMLNGNRERPNYLGVPAVTFTIPPLASVGMGEQQARDQGVQFRMQKQRVDEWYTARHVGERPYGFKVLVEEGSGRILGAHLVGPHADDLINIFALAIRHGLTRDQLVDTVFAYPTAASDIGYML